MIWRDRPAAWWGGLLAALAALYALGFAAWYSGTALGLSPVLDGKEMLLMARAIAAGELGGEPFYRAPLYPALLAPFAALGLDEPTLALVARLLNVAAHAASTLLVFRLALRLWQTVPAGLLAGALWGFNPVALHFLGDPLDTTLGITLLLAGLWMALKTLEVPENRLKPALFSGLWFGLAVLTRSHALTVALAWPVALATVGVVRQKSLRALAAPGAALGVLIGLLLVFGIANLAISGKLTLLPTQGAFNLYAANRESAHGRYHVQQVAMAGLDEHINPTRYEERELYERVPGHSQNAGLFERHAYWRAQFLERLKTDFAGWLGQMLDKAAALLHPFEQYNNKTFALHHERSPWLFWNLIGWAPIFGLAAPGVVLAINRRDGPWLLGAGLVYAAGVLLFYVSARFRLPLVPLLCVAAGWWVTGGAQAALKRLKNRERPQGAERWQAGAVAAILMLFGGVWLLKTYTLEETVAQDHLLIAQANAELGRDGDAIEAAIQALKYAPENQAARELFVVSRFNLRLSALLQNEAIPPPLNAWAELAAIEDPSPAILFIEGVYAYCDGERAYARDLWRALVEGPEPHSGAALSLRLTGATPPPQELAETPQALALLRLWQACEAGRGPRPAGRGG